MENGMIAIDSLTAVIGVAITVGSLIVSVLVFNAAVKERHSKSAAEQAGLSVKLDTALKTLDKMSADIEELRSDRAKDQAAIAELDAKFKGLDRRVGLLETNYKSLESKMHDYHTK